MTEEAPSALSASRLARACGLPSNDPGGLHYLNRSKDLECQNSAGARIGAKGFWPRGVKFAACPHR